MVFFWIFVVHVVGLAPGPIPALEGTSVDLQWNRCEPQNKRLKEQEFLENSQISSVDLLQTRSVSTGLGLSLDDRRVAAVSSGDSPVLSLFDEEIDRELQRQDVEMDRFVKVQVWSCLQLMVFVLVAWFLCLVAIRIWFERNCWICVCRNSSLYCSM